MADRGRVGSLVVASRSCAKKEWRNVHEGHRQRVKLVRPATDMTEPLTSSLESVRNNLKKERLLEDRYTEIDRENQNLLRKMAEIMKQPSAFTQKERSLPASLNQQGRKKDLMEITKENRRMLKAIHSVAPVYEHAKWEKNWNKSEHLLRNCCQYPVITRIPRMLSAPGRLIPIASEQSTEPYGMDGAGGDRSDGPVVFKDGKKIGDAYYLIEMSTDGRTLSISAYDGDTQQSFELVVKEKRHRQIHRDCNGDYSLLAARLRVDGDRLVLED